MVTDQTSRTVFFLNQSDDNTLVGVGFIVAPRWIATCAHVVSALLDNPKIRYSKEGPKDLVECTCFVESMEKLSGYTKFWDPMLRPHHYQPFSVTHDLALIEIEGSLLADEAPRHWNAEHPQYYSGDDLAYDVPVIALGPYLPEDAPDHARVENGRFEFTILNSHDAYSRLLLKLAPESPYPPREGLSGTPVFTKDGGELLGIIDRVNEGFSASAIPISAILAALRNQDPGLSLPPADDPLLTLDVDLPVDFRRQLPHEVPETISEKLGKRIRGRSENSFGNYLLNSGALPFVLQALHSSQKLSEGGSEANADQKPLTIDVRRFEKFARQFLISTDVSMLKSLHQLYPLATRQIFELSEDLNNLFESLYEGWDGINTALEEDFCKEASRRVNSWRKRLENEQYGISYTGFFTDIANVSSPALLRRLVSLRVMYSDDSSHPDEAALQGLKNLLADHENSSAETFGDRFDMRRFEMEWLDPLQSIAVQMNSAKVPEENTTQEEGREDIEQTQIAEFLSKFLALVRETVLLHWAVERFRLTTPYGHVVLTANEYDTILDFAYLGETKVVMLSDFFIQHLLDTSGVRIEDA